MAANLFRRTPSRAQKRLLALLGTLAMMAAIYLCLPKSWFEIPPDNAGRPATPTAQGSEESKTPTSGTPLSALQDTAGKNPLDYAARSRYGMALAATGRNVEALGEFQAAWRLAPDAPGVHHNLGIYYLNTRQFAQAEEAFSRELELAPADGRAHYFRGMVFQGQDRNPQAIAQFREAIALAPQFPDSYLSLAILLTRGGQEAEIHILIDNYIRLNGDKALAYYVLSGAYRTWKNYAEAARYAELTVKQAPDNYGYWHNMGQIYSFARRWEEADRALQRAQALSHDPTTTLIELGMNAQSARRFDQAAGYFKSALAASPDTGNIHQYLARLYRLWNKETEAQAEERLFRAWERSRKAVTPAPRHP